MSNPINNATKLQKSHSLPLLALTCISIFQIGCASDPTPRYAQDQDRYEVTKVEKERPLTEVRTMLGYTIPEAMEAMASTQNPYEISISECYTTDGTYIPELNRMRLRLINDFTARNSKEFMRKYDHQTLYPRK